MVLLFILPLWYDVSIMSDKIKIVFIDIDWTLLNHGLDKPTFDMESIEELKRVQQKNVLVYLCTARPYHSVVGSGILDIFTPDGIACTNGAVVFVGDKIIHNNCFNRDDVKEIIKVAHRHHLTIELADEKDRWFTKKPNKYVDYYFNVFHEIHPEIKKLKNQNISAVLLFSPQKFDEIISKELPKGIKLFRFADYGVEVQHEPIYKSEGVNATLKYLNIKPENAMAIGDDDNDISMFKAVGYSVCMENGKENAKKSATFVCPHINDHGVKIALQKFIKD